jgi:hypothetical protein
MDVFKIAVKIFASQHDVDHAAFVPVLHGWIQNQAVEEHLLIDVADYAHVVEGPGTVLVSSEANFYLDKGDNRLGLLYARKTPVAGDFADRLRSAVNEALKACQRLENDPALAGKLRFAGDEIRITLNDRLRAPNTTETLEQARPHVEALAAELFPDQDVQIEHPAAPLAPFELRIKAPQAPTVSTLLDRLIAAMPVSL